MSWPKTWWYRLAERWLPSRCREVPEATNPDRILLRQVLIFGSPRWGYLYLQQFASGENPDWYHSHPWERGTMAVGLWGSLTDVRYGGTALCRKRRRAPYINIMHAATIHQTVDPSPGHTSLFFGFGRKTDHKFYWDVDGSLRMRRHWKQHIRKLVKRL